MSMTYYPVKRLFYILLLATVIPNMAMADITIRLLTWEGYSPDNQVEKFQQLMQKKHNTTVKMDIKYISSADDYFDSIRRGRVDIIAPSHNIIKDARYKLLTEKLLIPINLDIITNYEKILPELQKAEYATEGSHVFHVPLVHGPYGLAYNTAEFPSPPDSWNIFWDKSNAGKYAVSLDYSEANIYVAALAEGFTKEDLTDLTKLASPKILKRLIALLKNAGSTWEGVDSADDLHDKKFGAAWGFSFPALAEKGQTWKMASPKEGTTGWVDGHSLTNALKGRPKHKEIAEEWINFSISDDFQLDAIVRGIGSAPVNTSITDQLTPQEVLAFHLDDPDYFKNNIILWPTLNIRQRNYFKKLWGDAVKQVK
jgi:spermidine/putrescine-binding protein